MTDSVHVYSRKWPNTSYGWKQGPNPSDWRNFMFYRKAGRGTWIWGQIL